MGAQEQILDALKDGQSWLDSNPEADAEEIKERWFLGSEDIVDGRNLAPVGNYW